MINQDLIHKIFNPNKYIIDIYTNHYELITISNSNKVIWICNDTIYKKINIYKERKNCCVYRNKYLNKIVINENYIKFCLRQRSLNSLLND